MSVSTLPLVPETTTVSGPGASAEPEYWPWAVPTKPLHTGTRTDAAPAGYVYGHSPATVATAFQRGASVDYPEWLHHVQAAAACKHPIRLSGQIHVNDHDGTRVATVDTEDMPDGVIYTPCGNRRASVCPSCAEVYRRDTYQIVKAGLEGGRWGIPPLHEHIAIFLTATAPSFGPVHHRVLKTHAADCRRKDGCTCRAQVCRPFGRICPHGIELRCRIRHAAGDGRLGQPLCLDCYDHRAHVVWHHKAPELWRRTIQQVGRNLRRLGRATGVELRRRYVKVYEYQVRGVIHYHALIRLDGYHPDCLDAVVPPPRTITRPMFEAAVRDAFVATSFTSAPHPANGGKGWRIGWGKRGLDLKHVNAPGGEVNLGRIAGYVAKYVTKSTEVTGLNVRRVDEVNLDVVADPASHTGRLVRACWDLGAHPDWRRLRRWAHQYGYGGHITTKSRAFSVTYGFKRWQRTIWRRTQGYPHTWTTNKPSGSSTNSATTPPAGSPPATPSSPTPPPPKPANDIKPASTHSPTTPTPATPSANPWPPDTYVSTRPLTTPQRTNTHRAPARAPGRSQNRTHNVPKGHHMNAPILQARVVAEPGHAQVLIAELTDRARQLLGPDVTYRAQTRTARRTGYVRVYLTATRMEEPNGGQP